MQDWMAQNRFTSPYLNWYINYACRDDYGALARDTSAWAGVHYFASRDPEEKGPLTWPEGNGWIVRQLIERLKPWLRTSSPVLFDRARRQSTARAHGGGRLPRRARDLRGADVSRALHRRRRAARPKASSIRRGSPRI